MLHIAMNEHGLSVVLYVSMQLAGRKTESEGGKRTRCSSG